MNENEDIAYQNLWMQLTSGLIGKFIAAKAYIKKVETCPINNVALHLKTLGNKEQ